MYFSPVLIYFLEILFFWTLFFWVSSGELFLNVPFFFVFQTPALLSSDCQTLTESVVLHLYSL